MHVVFLLQGKVRGRICAFDENDNLCDTSFREVRYVFLNDLNKRQHFHFVM